MTEDRYVYYAVVDEGYTREEPFAVIRRKPYLTGGGYDEGIGRGVDWKPISILIEADHGDTRWEFIEIDKAEADRLVEYFRAWRKAWQESQGQQSQVE